MIRTAIFDLDGTLLDTLGDIADCVNTALAAEGFPTHSENAYRRFVGSGVRLLIERACPAGTPNDIRTRVRAKYEDEYAVHYLRRTRPYDGAQEMLRSLAHEGAVLAVLSNKPHAMTVRLVEECFPGIAFAAVFGAREGVALKPEAGAVDEILAVTGGKRAHTFYLGDSDVDMLTARNAGVYGCGAMWGFRTGDELAKAGADILAADTAAALAHARAFFAALCAAPQA